MQDHTPRQRPEYRIPRVADLGARAAAWAAPVVTAMKLAPHVLDQFAQPTCEYMADMPAACTEQLVPAALVMIGGTVASLVGGAGLDRLYQGIRDRYESRRTDDLRSHVRPYRD